MATGAEEHGFRIRFGYAQLVLFRVGEEDE
jgi:hypothetical protein